MVDMTVTIFVQILPDDGLSHNVANMCKITSNKLMSKNELMCIKLVCVNNNRISYRHDMIQLKTHDTELLPNPGIKTDVFLKQT